MRRESLEVTYKPLDKAEVEEGIRSEVLVMPEPLQRFYRSVALPVYQAAYADSRERPSVFVLAKSGSRVVFYDGVEDDFGIGTIADETSLKDCGLVGELQFALIALQGSHGA